VVEDTVAVDGGGPTGAELHEFDGCGEVATVMVARERITAAAHKVSGW